ncbi:unnamed protein product, partial [Pylaiella littoralis]
MMSTAQRKHGHGLLCVCTHTGTAALFFVTCFVGCTRSSMRLFRIDSEKRRFGGIWYRVRLGILWSEGTIEYHGVFMCAPLLLGAASIINRVFPVHTAKHPAHTAKYHRVTHSGYTLPKTYPCRIRPSSTPNGLPITLVRRQFFRQRGVEARG